MGGRDYLIRRTRSSDWREIRSLRLEMIRDTPIAYAESLEDALGVDEAEWKSRGERGTAEQSISLAAITTHGQWVGMMGGYVPDPQTGPLLVGVYVTPAWRGREFGMADDLMAIIEEWAKAEGSSLTLHVHEENARARSYYLHRGFEATGHTVPYSLDPSARELAMVKTYPK
ncbi:MAG: GNAT family N-acetyltransferase [Acidobacteria bacterium]|nr:GNAT family N-acetyltransferase [Acidobacteriota bacterium]